MLSTLHRRHLLSLFEKEKTLSLKVLKKQFVESGEMNLTTLYRIIERFSHEGLIHQTEYDHEKYYTLCQCSETSDMGVKLVCCTNCHHVEESHFPLSPHALSAKSIEYMKHCSSCL